MTVAYDAETDEIVIHAETPEERMKLAFVRGGPTNTEPCLLLLFSLRDLCRLFAWKGEC